MTESKVLGLGCVVVDPLAVWQRIQMTSRYPRHCLVSSTDWQAFMNQPSSITPHDENVLEPGYCVRGQTREVADL
jgi:hypothetical protein